MTDLRAALDTYTADVNRARDTGMGVAYSVTAGRRLAERVAEYLDATPGDPVTAQAARAAERARGDA